ncbi:MFS transporter [Verrucomicrobium sp. GAS474]|uniref:MFS transporter n=1 Tax=Verrucomicrobium sp. GAS474 TaxID=1882831 RepID=UPI00138FAA64|nr:MFS transporter [Verrucomicrobium sp. GAS474]
MAVLLAWLLWGDFALSLRDRAVVPIVQLLFKRFGASDTTVGILYSSLPSLLGLTVGPIMGYWSDRYRSRLGRRIPFLLGTTPFIVLTMVGMAFCSQLGASLHVLLGSRSPGLGACSLGMLGTFWFFFEMCCVTLTPIYQGLLNDVVPQEVMGRVMGLVRAFSLGAGIVFNYGMMGMAKTHYIGILLAVAVLYGVGLTMMCLRVKEGGYPPPPESPAATEGGGLAGYCRENFGLGYYRLYFATVVLICLSPLAFNLFSLFYADSVGMSMDSYGKCIALTFGISLLLAYPLGALADRFHPLRVTIAGLVLYAAAMAICPLYVHDATSFGVALVVHGVLSGVAMTAAASLGQRLLPRSKFSEMVSVTSALFSLVQFGFAPALGLLLDRTGHGYVHTFHVSVAMTILAVIAGLFLYRRFVALGGPSGYRPPEI